LLHGNAFHTPFVDIAAQLAFVSRLPVPQLVNIGDLFPGQIHAAAGVYCRAIQ